MIVKVLSLGTNWWARSGGGNQAQQVYYNSTGVRCGRKVRRHWLVPGLLRFNADCFQARRLPGHSTFICSDLTHACGGNRLLFERPKPDGLCAEYYLVTMSSERHGVINFSSSVWRSIFTRVIAVSQLRERQEAMLLMRGGDWVQTDSGFWHLFVPERSGETPALLCPAHSTRDPEVP